MPTRAESGTVAVASADHESEANPQAESPRSASGKMSGRPRKRPGACTATPTETTASAAPASSYVLGATPPFWKASRMKPTPSAAGNSKSRRYIEKDLL